MELAQKKIAAQMPLDAKRDLCQYIIDNSGTREETAAQVDWPFLSSLGTLLPSSTSLPPH